MNRVLGSLPSRPRRKAAPKSFQVVDDDVDVDVDASNFFDGNEFKPDVVASERLADADENFYEEDFNLAFDAENAGDDIDADVDADADQDVGDYQGFDDGEVKAGRGVFLGQEI